MTERCDSYRTDRERPTILAAAENFDALYRCVYEKGHAGPHWQYGTKWMLDLEHEVGRLRSALVRIADQHLNTKAQQIARETLGPVADREFSAHGQPTEGEGH